MGLRTTYIRKPSRHAGKNKNSPERRGQHTASNRFRSGSNWIECQRCGHDVPSEDARKDGYTQGLLVCPKCYDPMHPQEFVRAYEDKIAPSSGWGLGGGDSFSTTGAEGSTDNPYSGVISEGVGTPTAISDQENDEGDTISTLATSGCFFTSYWDPLKQESVTISSFSATGLPTGLSINSSTGDITGTIDGDANDSSPYSVVVTAVWASGIVHVCDAFNWVVNSFFDPSAIANLELWWDLSERDGNFVFSDAARTTAITNNDPIEGLTDRSGNGLHAVTHSTPADNSWLANSRNGNGTGSNTARQTQSPLFHATAWSPGLAQPYTVVCVGEMHDSTVDVNRERWFTSNMSETDNLMVRFIGNAQQLQIHSQTSGDIDQLDTVTLAKNTWWMIMIEQNGASSRLWLNNQEVTPATSPHVNQLIIGWSFMGGSTTSTPDSGGGFDTAQGETCVYSTAVLSDADRNQLWTYMRDKWALTAILP